MPHWLSLTLISYELMAIVLIEALARAPYMDD
jgi:hypothetical protein